MKSTLNIRCAFSPGDNCRNLIIELIERSLTKIDICVFTISDNVITSAIINAYKRGIKIRIVTDNDKKNDLGSDIKEMHYMGIEIHIDQTPYHMHHKFMIVDKKTVLTGSYNWTRNAALYNQENTISITDSEVTKRFQSEFDRLWEESADLMNY